MKNLVLIGMMGCGKTTVGKLLGRRLGREFVDTDQYIEGALGRSIPDIFAQEGEDFFRAREGEAAEGLGRRTGQVIACGGGGIPVMGQGAGLKGASAVIEKDLAAGLLAKEVDADVLMILTSVDNVTLNYGQPDEQPLSSMTIPEAEAYIAQGQFEFASMLPKVEASVDFIRHGTHRCAIITSLEKAKASLAGKAGTTIQ